MLSLHFNLSNPWQHRWQNVWCRSYRTPFKHKFLELEFFKDTTIVSFALCLATRQDHGGISMELGLLGYSVSFNFYDNRHWNYETGQYFNHGEE